jgi:rhodanese-related sulfurtransferase
MKGQRVFQRLTALQLPAWRERHPGALLLDARDAVSFERDGWPGAVRLSGDNQDSLLLRTERARAVLIYCYHGNTSQTWAQTFADFGFTQVADLIGGQAAWLAAQSAPAPAAPPAPAPTAARKPLVQALAAWLRAEGFEDDPDARGPHGNTPLMLAAWRGDTATLCALLDHGVNLRAQNRDGNNALWLACVHGEPANLRRLVAAGVPIDQANSTGATSLMYASSSGKAEVLRELLALGADASLRTQDGFSALDMAANMACLNLLRPPRARPVTPHEVHP